MRYIFIISFLYSSIAFAIKDPVNILRACINNDNLTVTVSWKSPTDQCASFTKYRLYGSEDNDPFKLLAEITDLSINEYSHSLININTNWKYYITTLTTCNGIDSTISDTLTIDTKNPDNIGLDSVSYDLKTQNIIAGWKSNPSIDTDGYQVYDFSSGNGDSIGYTRDSFFTVTTNPQNRFPVAIATLDSCNLSSLISPPHEPAFLNSNIDTCDRTITLDWILYSGWNKIDKQVIFLSRNRSPFYSIDTLNGSEKTFKFNNFQLGDTLIFYIRSYNNNISSSSNKNTIETRAFVLPQYTYLNYVSVINNEDIELNWVSFPTTDISTYTIQKTKNPSTFADFNNTTNSSTYIDKTTDVSQETFYYRIIPNNKCDEPLDTSNSSRNIVLICSDSLTHNAYNGWENGTKNYTLSFQPTRSTWNDIKSNTFPITLMEEEIEPGCYSITAHENTNSLGLNNQSISNTLCKEEDLTFFVTTGVNANTTNNTFKIFGTGIDHEQSRYIIINRWGEKLIDNPTDIGWDLRYKNSIVPSGLYIYIATLYGKKGERKTEKGTINVIR